MKYLVFYVNLSNIYVKRYKVASRREAWRKYNTERKQGMTYLYTISENLFLSDYNDYTKKIIDIAYEKQKVYALFYRGRLEKGTIKKIYLCFIKADSIESAKVLFYTTHQDSDVILTRPKMAEKMSYTINEDGETFSVKGFEELHDVFTYAQKINKIVTFTTNVTRGYKATFDCLEYYSHQFDIL